MSSDLISRSYLKQMIPAPIEDEYKYVHQIIDNAPAVELANHLSDRIKDIDHEITIPQSYEAKCFLDGKRKAFQYVLDLLKGGVGNE